MTDLAAARIQTVRDHMALEVVHDWDGVIAALQEVDYQGTIVVESFLPTVKEIARAVSLWRPVAPSMDALAEDGAQFLLKALAKIGRG